MSSLDYDHKQYADYVDARVRELNKTAELPKSNRDWRDEGMLWSFDDWREGFGTVPLRTMSKAVKQLQPIYIQDLKERLKFVAMSEFQALLQARIADLREIEQLAREMDEEDNGFGVF